MLNFQLLWYDNHSPRLGQNTLPIIIWNQHWWYLSSISHETTSRQVSLHQEEIFQSIPFSLLIIITYVYNMLNDAWLVRWGWGGGDLRDAAAGNLLHLSLFWVSCTVAVLANHDRFSLWCSQPSSTSVCLCTFLPPGCPAGWSLTGCHDGVTSPNHSSFLLFTVASRGSYVPVSIAAWESAGVIGPAFGPCNVKKSSKALHLTVLNRLLHLCCQSPTFKSKERDWEGNGSQQLQFSWKADVSALPRSAKLCHCCHSKS